MSFAGPRRFRFPFSRARQRPARAILSPPRPQDTEKPLANIVREMGWLGALVSW